MEIISLIGILTNIAMIIMTFDAQTVFLDAIAGSENSTTATPAEVGLYLYFSSKYNFLWFMIIVEHLIIILKLVVSGTSDCVASDLLKLKLFSNFIATHVVIYLFFS